MVAKTIEANVTPQQGQVGRPLKKVQLVGVRGHALGSTPILQIKPSNVTTVRGIVTNNYRTLVY